MMLCFFMSLFVALNAICSFAAGETGCPHEEDIEPCHCFRYPIPRLICRGLKSTDVLVTVFHHSERYSYQEVHIIDSQLLYIPVEIFQKTTVKELYLTNSSLVGFLSEPVDGNKHTYKVKIENLKFVRGVASPNFSSFNNLKELVIQSTSMQSISSKYSEVLPKNLKILRFYATGTKKIAPGALSQHPYLDKFVVESNKLSKLVRDSFPRPFYARTLNFANNKISSIADDLFHDMPNLQFLNMKNNLISTIPEVAFEGRRVNIPFFKFEGNPLQCDCRLLWILKDKPEVLGGNCTSPEKLQGRNLQDLKPTELLC